MTGTLSADRSDESRTAAATGSWSDDIDDSQWVARIRAGEERAAEALVRTYGGRMLAVARRYLSCESECEDAVQDAFLSAFRALGSFKGDSRLSTWLHRIVVNACLMKLRTRSRRHTVLAGDLLPAFDESGHHVAPVEPWASDAGNRLGSKETRALVRAGIDRLPEPYRNVLLLRDIEEFDTAETARILRVSTAVVKTRLHRARQALRTLLTPHFEADPRGR